MVKSALVEEGFADVAQTYLVSISSVQLIHPRLCGKHVRMRPRLDLRWTPVRLVDNLIQVST